MNQGKFSFHRIPGKIPFNPALEKISLGNEQKHYHSNLRQSDNNDVAKEVQEPLCKVSCKPGAKKGMFKKGGVLKNYLARDDITFSRNLPPGNIFKFGDVCSEWDKCTTNRAWAPSALNARYHLLRKFLDVLKEVSHFEKKTKNAFHSVHSWGQRQPHKGDFYFYFF